MSRLNFIDLFSGAGGLSEGFINADMEPIAHVEIDANACRTLETRLTYYYLKDGDLLNHYHDYLKGNIPRDKFIEKHGCKRLSDSVINEAIGDENNERIFRKINELANGKNIDIIIGGPPCQAYSLVGRARDKNGMKNDPRNHLYIEYGKFLEKYTPKVFVFENVQGLRTANGGKYFEHMKEHFQDLGYEVEAKIQNASDFGVLQNRKRVILIGWEKGTDFKYPQFKKNKSEWKIKDLLIDLKPLKPGEQNNVTKYVKNESPYLRKHELKNGVDFVTQHIARPHNDRDLEIYKIAIEKWLNDRERLQYPDLPKRLKTHKNEKAFTDRFKVVDPEGYSHTMVAHIAKDGHYYIYPDLNQVRSISVREAARIQSFPDDFFFEGGRSAAFRQIGNAVPPLMAKEIAMKLKKQL